MKNKFIIATFLGAFLLATPNVKAANFTDNQTVDTNKTWTIKFTSEVALDDATKEGITVTDSKGNPVSIDIQFGQDSKTVTITAPTGGYTPGEKYILAVSSKVHTKNSKNLKHSTVLNFNIKNNNIDVNSEFGSRINNLISNVVQSIQPSETGDITYDEYIKFGVINIMRNNWDIIDRSKYDETSRLRLKSSQIEQASYKYFGVTNEFKHSANDNGYDILYNNDDYYYFHGITITESSISTLDKLIDQGEGTFVAYGKTYCFGIDYLCEDVMKTNKEFNYNQMYTMSNQDLKNLIHSYPNSFDSNFQFKIIIKKVNDNYYITSYKKL